MRMFRHPRGYVTIAGGARLRNKVNYNPGAYTVKAWLDYAERCAEPNTHYIACLNAYASSFKLTEQHGHG